jgi:predicted Rossmann fold flavoprotein
LETSGPLLITHWGLSGPAILKLSAWGARQLYDCGYVFDLNVNWKAEQDKKNILEWLQNIVNKDLKKKITNLGMKDIPSRLWKYFCSKADINEDMNYAEVGKKRLDKLADALCHDVYRVTGKSTFKEEFVTAGGVELKEINMKSFESKIQPGLFLVGEVLNIDALTGGFNFQAAWTGAELAATGIAQKLKN